MQLIYKIVIDTEIYLDTTEFVLLCIDVNAKHTCCWSWALILKVLRGIYTLCACLCVRD